MSDSVQILDKMVIDSVKLLFSVATCSPCMIPSHHTKGCFIFLPCVWEFTVTLVWMRTEGGILDEF